MATLEKIRNKAGLLVIVVGVALFAFIIGDFLNSGSTFFRQNQEKIIEVDGNVISIQQYQERIDEMTEFYKMQSGMSSLPEEYMNQIRQSVYNSMVQELVLTEAMDKLGMTVCPEELFDMVQGNNISPILQQNQMFHNPETGMFDKMALLDFLKAVDDDNIATLPPDQQSQLLPYRSFWLFMEKNIKLQRMEQKYTTLLSKAIAANALDAKEAFNETTESSSIMYAMQPYSTIPDSTISVTKSELEKLYNQRKEAYRQAETKVIKYIAIDILPSEADYAKAGAEIETIKEELAASGHTVADIVNENSEIPYSDVFLSESTLDPEIKAFAASASIGEIYGPVFENNRYRMFKLVDKTIAPDSVKVEHIMIAGTGRDEVLADSLLNELKAGGDFAEIARTYSADQAAKNGGDVGWLTEMGAKAYVNDEFKQGVFSAPLNELKQMKSLYGIHLYKVTEKTANVQKYKVANVEMTVSPSSKTYSNIYNELNQFISKNQDIDKFDDAAKEAGYNVRSNVNVTANDQTVEMISQSRPVVRWAFQNKKGSISEIFECENKFVVAAIQGTIPEGYRPLSLVEELKPVLIAEKKGKIIADELKSKNLTSLDAYAQAMNASVDSVKFINFNTRRITGIGAEPKLNAMIALAKSGQLSEPVIGNNGVYVFQVYERSLENAAYDEKTQIATLDASNAYRFGYQAVQTLIGRAKITDNRIRFY
ncbi:MAG: SurA N-terminal domain-containing protein [Tannerellaceae bacterium]|jgi:peptidyl-prolyl cis-trans isomerase D|nr:SurA N-terminal domain-containing protein [Tannerellaceae bacterium]